MSKPKQGRPILATTRTSDKRRTEPYDTNTEEKTIQTQSGKTIQTQSSFGSLDSSTSTITTIIDGIFGDCQNIEEKANILLDAIIEHVDTKLIDTKLIDTKLIDTKLIDTSTTMSQISELSDSDSESPPASVFGFAPAAASDAVSVASSFKSTVSTQFQQMPNDIVSDIGLTLTSFYDFIQSVTTSAVFGDEMEKRTVVTDENENVISTQYMAEPDEKSASSPRSVKSDVSARSTSGKISVDALGELFYNRGQEPVQQYIHDVLQMASKKATIMAQSGFELCASVSKATQQNEAVFSRAQSELASDIGVATCKGIENIKSTCINTAKAATSAAKGASASVVRVAGEEVFSFSRNIFYNANYKFFTMAMGRNPTEVEINNLAETADFNTFYMYEQMKELAILAKRPLIVLYAATKQKLMKLSETTHGELLKMYQANPASFPSHHDHAEWLKYQNIIPAAATTDVELGGNLYGRKTSRRTTKKKRITKKRISAKKRQTRRK